MSRASSALAILLAASTSFGCWEQVSRGWFASMKKSPAVQVSEDHQPLAPPDGNVPVGGINPRVAPDSPLAMTPMFAPEAAALVNPIAFTQESTARGQQLYNTYCAVCHAEDGMASPQNAPVAGLLAKAGAPPFPLSTTVAYTDGQIYTKIRYGKPMMPGYPQIPSDDRWHIVNYLRTLFRKG